MTSRSARAAMTDDGRRTKKRKVFVRSARISPWFSHAVMNRARRPVVARKFSQIRGGTAGNLLFRIARDRV